MSKSEGKIKRTVITALSALILIACGFIAGYFSSEPVSRLMGNNR